MMRRVSRGWRCVKSRALHTAVCLLLCACVAGEAGSARHAGDHTGAQVGKNKMLDIARSYLGSSIVSKARADGHLRKVQHEEKVRVQGVSDVSAWTIRFDGIVIEGLNLEGKKLRNSHLKQLTVLLNKNGGVLLGILSEKPASGAMPNVSERELLGGLLVDGARLRVSCGTPHTSLAEALSSADISSRAVLEATQLEALLATAHVEKGHVQSGRAYWIIRLGGIHIPMSLLPGTTVQQFATEVVFVVDAKTSELKTTEFTCRIPPEKLMK